MNKYVKYSDCEIFWTLINNFLLFDNCKRETEANETGFYVNNTREDFRKHDKEGLKG